MTERKRASKRTLRVAAAAGAAVAFALPWAALKAAPHPPGPQRIVVVQGGKVTHAASPAGSVTTTRASGAPVVH